MWQHNVSDIMLCGNIIAVYFQNTQSTYVENFCVKNKAVHSVSIGLCVTVSVLCFVILDVRKS